MSQFIGFAHNLILHKMEKGELNIDSLESLRSVLKEYEIHTKIIEDQLEMCKRDHVDLRGEMNQLLSENRDLYVRLETALKRTDQPANEDTDIVDNLRAQLSFALEEKETLEALWKSSVQEVDELNEKLQEKESGKQLLLTQNQLNDVQKDYSEAIKILEEKKSALKVENDQLNAKCQLLEDQLKQFNIQMASVSEKNLLLSNSLKESTELEQQWKAKYLELETKLIALEQTYQSDKVKYAQIEEYEKVETGLKLKLEETLRSRDELQCALERCQERMQEQLKLAAIDRSKIEEAVTLVEGACRDRELALTREMSATEETKRLRGEMEKLVDAAGRRVLEEEANLRKQFDNELATVKQQLKVVEQDRNRKKIEVEQLQEECERLRNVTAKNQLSKNQADKLAKKLTVVESTCERLRLEKEGLKESVEKLEAKCKRNTQQRQKLKSSIQRLVNDTHMYQEELAMSEQKADLLNSQLQVTSLDLAQHQSNTILQKGTGLESQVPSLTSTLELYRKLTDSYGHMNDRWKNEMSSLTDKFEEKLKKAKKKGRVSFEKLKK